MEGAANFWENSLYELQRLQTKVSTFVLVLCSAFAVVRTGLWTNSDDASFLVPRFKIPEFVKRYKGASENAAALAQKQGPKQATLKEAPSKKSVRTKTTKTTTGKSGATKRSGDDLGDALLKKLTKKSKREG